jgi:hypothetical protein
MKTQNNNIIILTTGNTSEATRKHKPVNLNENKMFVIVSTSVIVPF